MYLMHFNYEDVELNPTKDILSYILHLKYLAFKDQYYSEIIRSSSIVTLKHILGIV